jgi:hypothetical protein
VIFRQQKTRRFLTAVAGIALYSDIHTVFLVAKSMGNDSNFI